METSLATADDSAELDPRAREVLDRMVRCRAVDDALVALQRSGTLPAYTSLQGEEAVVVGAALALAPDDMVFVTAREALVTLVRGWPLAQLAAQLLGRASDIAEGRQPPGLLTARTVHVASIGSLVGTHIVHAAGWGWAARAKGDRRIALAFFGDGATSSADFHNGLNFAAVFEARVVFLCRNNGVATSTPVHRQTASETLAEKAVAYGIPAARCDGNDAVAVLRAVERAADRARSGKGPTLIEAVTTRLEVDEARCPIARLRARLVARGEAIEDVAALLATHAPEVDAVLAAVALEPGPSPGSFLSSVYASG